MDFFTIIYIISAILAGSLLAFSIWQDVKVGRDVKLLDAIIVLFCTFCPFINTLVGFGILISVLSSNMSNIVIIKGKK